MKMMYRILTAALCLSMIGAAQSRTPVVVELFTSEGCSSCPPADNLLSRLVRTLPDIEVIALSEHVDYWNHLGWQDRFSSALFTARQQDYGRIFRLESVYTPEMVVNGQAEFNGSDEPRARNEILKAAQSPRASVELSVQSGVAHLKVEKLPEGTRSADMFLAVTETNLETTPRAGENGGRRLRHTGVVRSLTGIGHLDTKKAAAYTADAKVNLNNEWNPQNLKLVLFVQDRSSRKIVGAATAQP
jgi:hypothetical protein